MKSRNLSTGPQLGAPQMVVFSPHAYVYKVIDQHGSPGIMLILESEDPAELRAFEGQIAQLRARASSRIAFRLMHDETPMEVVRVHDGRLPSGQRFYVLYLRREARTTTRLTEHLDMRRPQPIRDRRPRRFS